MPTEVVKVLPDGSEEVLHANLQDDDAVELASRVIASNREAGVEVKVRLTRYVWDGGNAEYRLDREGAQTLPRDPEPEPEPEAVAAKPKSK